MALWQRICLPVQEMQETWVHSLGWKDPLEKGDTTTPVFLPGKTHGQRSLAGCSPWGPKELDTTEQAHITCYSETWMNFLASPMHRYYLKFNGPVALELKNDLYYLFWMIEKGIFHESNVDLKFRVSWKGWYQITGFSPIYKFFLGEKNS